ncbi:MAG TPA: peptidylprolyl isomerase [Candidatus Limnocylindria bacterium]|nr:peptidylprolyl isomerase [Candidatus Limnocylindria bacterium]
MARRIPLPRLTQRQRQARWQRERRQQTIIIVVFTVLLCSAIGLMIWAGTNRYYDANLKPAAMIDGHALPYRLYFHERDYELVKFYQNNGVPAGRENDPQLASQKADYNGIAVNSLVEQALLDSAAHQDGYAISTADLQARYEESFSQYSSRHVLVAIDATATDKAAADAAAVAKAQDIATQLRADPNNQVLWNTVAKLSDDTGSKDSGGEIGWVGNGELVKEYDTAARALTIRDISEPVKSQFGYHVIQVKERRAAAANPVVQRWLSSGFGMDEILLHTKYDMLRLHYTAVAQQDAVTSPTEQIHLLHILISLPSPTSQVPTDFTNALKKIGDAKAALDKGTDFAEVAKTYSEDTTEAASGGDAGWFARGQLDSVTKETELFALAPGTISRQFSTIGQAEFYKVAEKDPARALTDAQTTKIHDSAYAYWFDKQRRAHDVRKLVPGYEFQP